MPFKREPSATYGMSYWSWRRDLREILAHQWISPTLRFHLEYALAFIESRYAADIALYEALPAMEP